MYCKFSDPGSCMAMDFNTIGNVKSTQTEHGLEELQFAHFQDWNFSYGGRKGSEWCISYMVHLKEKQCM